MRGYRVILNATPLSSLLHWFWISTCGRASLLVHPIQMMDRPVAMAERMSFADGRCHIGLGKKHGFRQASAYGEVAGD